MERLEIRVRIMKRDQVYAKGKHRSIRVRDFIGE